MQQEKTSLGIMSALKQAFPFFDEDDDKNSSVAFETGAGYVGATLINEHSGENQGSLTGQGRKDNRFKLEKMPINRFAQYAIFSEMAEDSTIDAALNIHLGHALSVSNDSGLSVYLHAKDEKFAEYVEALNRELLTPINDELMNWCYPTVVHGCNYVRPYVEQGKGIVHFEANYYTLPNQIREYERSGELCGFTSENLTNRRNGDQVRLAEPWALIPLKMPTHRPNMHEEPVHTSGKKYSLYDDAYARTPVETQNYGTSMLHASYEAWTMLRQSIASLGASRVNASLIERVIGVNTDGLDVSAAADYINLIADQMQKDRQEVVNQSRKLGFIPTVMNTFLPIMGGNSGNKGGVQMDTFTTDPNIAHIEDIMFHLKRLAGTLGVDPSMLGFGDLLSGGLGDGGFFRVSIQSALRAQQVRTAVAKFVRRAIDIHTIYRDGKVWSDVDCPFEIKFNSLNTAIATEQASERESKANYATILATALDLIENSPISSSGKLKTFLYTDVLGMSDDLAKEIISELSKKATSDDKMMESLGVSSRAEAEQFIRDTFLDLISEIH